MSAARLAGPVRTAMEAGDVEAMFALLAPDVRWGPADDSASGCHNRRQVRAGVPA